MPTEKAWSGGIPESDKKVAEELLTRYCDERVPEHVRNKVRLLFRWRGATVTIFETRPYFQDVNRWTESPIAQFRYNAADIHWTLFCPDRNSRWHLYLEVEPARSLQTLIEEVDRDPTGIFWG